MYWHDIYSTSDNFVFFKAPCHANLDTVRKKAGSSSNFLRFEGTYSKSY